ncbi:MAG: hypothetical protein JJV97_04960 [SAR324 cluster bacterium]|nr:hypothetical protein [SAR324 cluster bacterium]
MKNLLILMGFFVIFFNITTNVKAYAGYVYFIKGVAQRKLPDTLNEFIPLTKKEKIQDGQEFRTGESSDLVVRFRDGSVIHLFENSLVKLKSLTELGTRKFLLDFTLEHGTISVLVSRDVEVLSARISTYVVGGFNNGCFSASNNLDLGLTRIKAADVELSISEELTAERVRPRQVFVRFEKAFAFTSKSFTFLSNRIDVGVDSYIEPLISASVQLSDIKSTKIIKKAYPISVISYPHFIFDDIFKNLDQDGYLFISSNLTPFQRKSIDFTLTCFELADPVDIFSYATGVLRGFEAVKY